MTNKVLNIDCMEYMKDIPDKWFKLAIVDPPYGIDINMNMGRKAGQLKAHAEKQWDKSIPDEIYFNELFRVSKFQIIWGGNYLICLSQNLGYFGIKMFLKELALRMGSLHGQVEIKL